MGSALAYMMSPRQVLFSKAKKEGRRRARGTLISRYVRGATPAELGFAEGASSDAIQVSAAGTPNAELIVKLPKWSDGTPVGGPAKN